MLRSEQAKGILSLLILAWVFATMPLFVRTLDTVAELFTQTYLRIGIACIVALILFSTSLRIHSFRTLPRHDLLVLLLRAISLYIAVALFSEAVLHTSLSNASIIAAVPLLPLFGYVFLRERVSRPALLAIGVGFIGALFIVVNDTTTLRVGYGEFMAFLSMLAFDFSYTARKLHSEHLNNKESSVFMFFVGTVFLFVLAQVSGESLPDVTSFSPIILTTLGLAAIFNVANLYLTNYGFSKVKVGVAGNILTLEVVFALLYSILLFSEIPALRELIGGTLIVGSVIAVNWFERTQT
jgi:drug/metabolite transporter (DMT)-like permease